MDNNKEKEIDLLEISGKVARGIRMSFGNILSSLRKMIKTILVLILKLFILLMSSWKMLSIIGAIIGGISLFLYQSDEPYYNSDAHAISAIPNTGEIIQIINTISIPNDKSNSSLKNDLQLSPEIYNNILSVKASWFIDTDGDSIADLIDYNSDYQFKQGDTLSSRIDNRFNIRLELKEPGLTDEVQIALERYLYEHPYIYKQNRRRLNKLEATVQMYEKQASILDSLQVFEYFKEVDKNTIQSLKIGEFELIGQNEEQKDKRLYYEDIITLKENYIESKASLDYEVEAISFIGNFSSVNVSRVNSLMSYIKRVSRYLTPIALLIFLYIKRDELEKIFKNRKYLKN